MTHFPKFPYASGLMIYLFNLIFRFVNSDFIFKLNGMLISLSTFLFEIVIANSQSWRQWEFSDKVVKFVYFGLSKAHYTQELNVSGTVIKSQVHIPISSSWSISQELRFAKNLIVCAILMKIVVLVFSTTATRISCMVNPYLQIEPRCYKVSAIVLFLSGLFTLASVSWNHFIDHYGQSTFEFPPEFPVTRAALINKHYTAVLPLGILSAIVSFFGVISFLSAISNLELESGEHQV